MTIWVDGDACPKVVRDILFRASMRVEVPLIFVANQALAVPSSVWIKTIQVQSGFDVADDYIVKHVTAGDLVITSDIPLAADLIDRGASVLSARGESFTRQNIRQKLNMRDFMDTMRASGMTGGGPAPLDQRDKQRFANALDRYLTQSTKNT